MADSTAHCLHADVSVAGSNYYVRILSTIDRELLKPSASVALHKHSNALVDVLPPEADSSISMLQAGVLRHGVLQYISTSASYL
jgi:ATP-dependent 26S proteasome regulatory subunit